MIRRSTLSRSRWLTFLAVIALIGLLALALGACTTTPATAPPAVEKTVVVVETVVVTEKETVIVEVTAEAPTPEPAPEGSKTIIRVGTGDSGEGLNPHQQIISAFEAANQDILVQLEAVAGSDYYARLLTQVAAGAAPDIMQIGDDAVPQFVDAGAIVALDDYIASSDGLDLGIYLPNLVDPGKYNGTQYMLPKDFSPLAVYYNKKLFDQYEIDYPQDGWTWEQFLETAQALTIDENNDGEPEVWGVQLPANWTTGFEYWVSAAGGSLISEDGKSFVGYMDSPEVQKAVQFFSDLYGKHKVAPPPADFSQWAGGNTEFENGKAAMRLFGRWPQAGYLTNPNLDLGIVGPPVGDERANVLFWGGFGISSTAKNPEAAWRFLKYYTGEPGSEVWKDWALPAVQSVAESSGKTDDPIDAVWLNELQYVKPRAYTFTPFWGQTADPALRKALETMLIKPDSNVADVMTAAAQEAQQALDEQMSQ
jgi:multiple sugar transport system substrate-binding protein